MMTPPPDPSLDADARLLLQALGELPAEATDDGRRTALRRAVAAGDAALAALDAATPLSATTVDRAARRAARAVELWQDRPAVAGVIGPVAAESPWGQGRVWRVARWPLGAAAALVLGLVVWTLTSDPSGMIKPPLVSLNALPTDSTPANPSANPPVAAAVEEEPGAVERLAALFDPPTLVASAAGLGGDYRGRLDDLAALSDPDPADADPW